MIQPDNPSTSPTASTNAPANNSVNATPTQLNGQANGTISQPGMTIDPKTGLPIHQRRQRQGKLIEHQEVMKRSNLLKYEIWSWYEALFAWIPGRPGNILRSLAYRPWFKHLGRNVRIDPFVAFHYPWGLSVGNNVHIQHGAVLNAFGGLELKDRVRIGPYSIIFTFAHLYLAEKPEDVHKREAAPVVVEEDVWITSGCSISPGVTLLRGMIVGPGSAVVPPKPGKEFWPNTIIQGLSAVYIRDRQPGDDPASVTRQYGGEEAWIRVTERQARY